MSTTIRNEFRNELNFCSSRMQDIANRAMGSDDRVASVALLAMQWLRIVPDRQLSERQLPFDAAAAAPAEGEAPKAKRGRKSKSAAADAPPTQAALPDPAPDTIPPPPPAAATSNGAPIAT